MKSLFDDNVVDDDDHVDDDDDNDDDVDDDDDDVDHGDQEAFSNRPPLKSEIMNELSI